jgi:hypothetical protein
VRLVAQPLVQLELSNSRALDGVPVEGAKRLVFYGEDFFEFDESSGDFIGMLHGDP